MTTRPPAFCASVLLSAACALTLASCAPAEKPASQAAKPALLAAPMRVLVLGADANAVAAVKKTCEAAKLEVRVTDKAGNQDADKADPNAEPFTLTNLLRYRTVVLAGFKADSLSEEQRTALEGFVQSGGGLALMGTEPGNWSWLRRLTGDLDAARVLGKVTGPKETLLRAFDGGRAFVPAEKAPAEELDKGLRFAAHIGEAPFALNPELRRPTDDYFEIGELAGGLEDPMGMTPLPGGRMLILERHGAVKLFSPGQGVRTLTTLQVDAEGLGKRGGNWYEGGGLGIAADPDFGVKNDFVYIYYSTPAVEGPDRPGKNINRLSRFRLVDDEMLSYEKTLLEVPDDRDQKVCHEGGSVRFGADRLLYLSCGDNTNPFESDGYDPIDERPGRWRTDAQRTSGNTNDLRGGVSRIRINETGDGYTIPEGNLFKPGTPKTRPELFVKGCRNVWRIAVDSKTGGVAWGDVGPDAGGTNNNRGPVGYDFIGYAPKGGYFGWPYARGPVNVYKNVHDAWYTRHDFATGKNSECFADGIRNTSPNNTGMETLPPVQQSLVWYHPGGPTAEFPEMGGGGRTACVSVVYNQEGRAKSLPAWFDHVLISHEWTRARLDLLKLDKDGKLESILPFLRNLHLMHPVDMAQDANGDLYLLEYGGGWTGNKNGGLFKIAFKGWKRPPIITLNAAERFGGLAAPFAFEAQISTAENNPFTAEWDFDDGTVEKAQISKNKVSGSHVYKRSNRYEAKLTVTDTLTGAVSTRIVPVSAGNSYPTVKVAFRDAPAQIPWGGELKLNLKADDAEDGDLTQAVAVTATYGVPFNKPLPDPRLIGLDPSLRGTQLMAANSCVACHAALSPNVGPAYAEVAKHYKNDPARVATLTASITNGVSGKWGSHAAMPSFGTLPKKDIQDLIAAIHSLANPSSVNIPVENGVIKLPKERPAGIPDNAVLSVQATVMDKGAKGLIPLTSHAGAVFAEKK